MRHWYGFPLIAMLLLPPAPKGAKAAPPPPPPSNGSPIAPPSSPPPGKIFFEDNVVIVAPGVTPPPSQSGTRFIVLPSSDPGLPSSDSSSDPARRVRTTVERLTLVKTQIESLSGTPPIGLRNPAGLIPVRVEGEGSESGLFLHEAAPAGEPLRVDRTDPSRSVGVAVEAPPTALPRRPRGVFPLSYWQLPIR